MDHTKHSFTIFSHAKPRLCTPIFLDKITMNLVWKFPGKGMERKLKRKKNNNKKKTLIISSPGGCAAFRLAEQRQIRMLRAERFWALVFAQDVILPLPSRRSFTTFQFPRVGKFYFRRPTMKTWKSHMACVGSGRLFNWDEASSRDTRLTPCISHVHIFHIRIHTCIFLNPRIQNTLTPRYGLAWNTSSLV